jgi:protein transport protein SEC24
MFIYLGMGLSGEFTQSVFGVQTVQQIDTERGQLPVFDNKWSKRVREIVESIQKGRARCMRVSLTK